MRKKIKELLHKEEGFTLVELLAVIVILGIIVAIAVPAIGGIIDDSRTKADVAEAELVIDAAQLYVASKSSEEETIDSPIPVATLVSDGYLEDKDSFGAENVSFEKAGNAYSFTYNGITRGAENSGSVTGAE